MARVQGSTSDGDRHWFRPILTLIVVALSAWWLLEVSRRLGTAPTLDSEGNITVDEFQRAKDILLVVLPLTTITLGYWFGAQGKTAAETKADAAEKKAEEASAALTAVVATSTQPDLLRQAQQQYPQAFQHGDGET